jgi:hypothetical protein
MERLPYIDEHSITVAASRERVWEALPAMLRASFGAALPTALAGPLLRLSPAVVSGEWRCTPQLGDCLPGFAVEEVLTPQRLALAGHHRFSNYRLLFELEERGPNSCILHARTWAAFPGITGRAYRALVIGSRGHRVLLRRLLAEIARRA